MKTRLLRKARKDGKKNSSWPAGNLPFAPQGLLPLRKGEQASRLFYRHVVLVLLEKTFTVLQASRLKTAKPDWPGLFTSIRENLTYKSKINQLLATYCLTKINTCAIMVLWKRCAFFVRGSFKMKAQIKNKWLNYSQTEGC